MKQFFKNSWVKLVLIFSVVDWRDVGIRSVKTLVQTFIALLGTALASGGSKDAILTTALAGAVCALWNGVWSPVWKAIGQKADEVIVAAETEHVSTTDGSMVQVDVATVKDATIAEVKAALTQAEQDALEEIKKG